MSIITPAPSHNGRHDTTPPHLHDPSMLISNRATAPVTQSFRLLAANVEMELSATAGRALAVVSAHPGDGRSLVAANLAIALAERHSVLLVEEERRALSRLFRASVSAARDGIPSELRRSVTETSEPGVYMMQWVQPNADDQDRLAEAISAASRSGMFTIIDTPPALVSSDAYLIAKQAGHALYVMRSGEPDLQVHRRVKTQIERLGGSVLGIVLNHR